MIYNKLLVALPLSVSVLIELDFEIEGRGNTCIPKPFCKRLVIDLLKLIFDIDIKWINTDIYQQWKFWKRVTNIFRLI